MTHSLHRRGSLEELKQDYVLVAMTSKVNKELTKPTLAKVAEIIFSVGVSNTGSSGLETNMPMGFDVQEFIRDIPKSHGLLCSFPTKEQLRLALARLKEADLGISITVSGLIDEVIPLAQGLGLKPHTINLSLGIIGKTEKLPSEEILEFSTMCGHSLVSANLVKKGIADVACGAKTPREASMMMGKPCVCGIYNLDRSDRLVPRRGADA
ncbi:MAG: hypothetical protein M1582_02570 [Actinobacteria bacterium]|nr:hypothetical protein [Actinomycetota bacterium]